MLWRTLIDIRREFRAVGDDPTDMRFVLAPQFLLTVRRSSRLRRRIGERQVEAGAAFESSAALFERMLIATADAVGEAAQRIAAELDSIEDRILSEAFSDESGKLLKLRREAFRHNRLVHAAQGLLEQIDQRREEGVLDVYREMAARVRQRVASFHADLHLQGERRACCRTRCRRKSPPRRTGIFSS